MRQDISQCPACTNRQQPENLYMHMISWCRFQTILCPRPTKDEATISKYMSIFIIRTSENFIIWNEVKDFFIVLEDGHTFEHDICFCFPPFEFHTPSLALLRLLVSIYSFQEIIHWESGCFTTHETDHSYLLTNIFFTISQCFWCVNQSIWYVLKQIQISFINFCVVRIIMICWHKYLLVYQS